MPRDSSVGDLGGPFADHDLGSHVAAGTSTGSSGGDPQCTSGPQAGHQFTLERTATLDVEGLVDL